MIKWPKFGMRAVVHYRKTAQSQMPYQGKKAFIHIVANGKGPKNILVIIDSVNVIIPRGNLKI
jgi:hypothetical protein